MRRIPVLLLALLLFGCNQPGPEESGEPAGDAGQPADTASGDAAPADAMTAGSGSASERLEAVLAEQPEEVKARYPYRHPQETLMFFGIEPGMTVVEALPGGGWYSQVLIPYLGEDGRLIGANYARDMWPKFEFADQEFLDSVQTWTADWPEEARQWQGEDGAQVDAFMFGEMPEELAGQADAVLFIRALHNLARFEGEGGFLTQALEDAHLALKPGGILGVVQHEARPDMPDEWASGENGYLKKEFVIERAEAAGFEFVDEIDVNQNPKDQPTQEDVVWRLPPSYGTSQDDPELKAQMDEIGESNRMTLKFRKMPSEAM
jgi:predicted methyltransferase